MRSGPVGLGVVGFGGEKGEMAEWTKATVLKTVGGNLRGFESYSRRFRCGKVRLG